MDNEKPVQIDEKTARLIEEMEKSLHNMEKTLGNDHLVVAKILDSYARLLRQNNLRHLDALNMEARAKAIRAKHNQEESEKQGQGLENQHVEKPTGFTMGHLRIAVWAVSIMVAGFFFYSVVDAIKMSEVHMKKLRAKAVRKQTFETYDPKQADSATQESPAEQSEKTATTTAADAEAPQADSPQQSEQQADQKLESAEKPAVSQPVAETSAARVQAPDGAAAISDRINQVKDEARSNLDAGSQAEGDKDYPKALQAYQSTISNVRTAEQETHHRICSEEIARCYEGYARLAEMDSQHEIAQQWEQAASDVRSHM